MTIEQIKQNINYGDYNILARMLGKKSVQASRMRFLREEPTAVEAMKAIQESREELIKSFKSKLNNQKI